MQELPEWYWEQRRPGNQPLFLAEQEATVDNRDDYQMRKLTKSSNIFLKWALLILLLVKTPYTFASAPSFNTIEGSISDLSIELSSQKRCMAIISFGLFVVIAVYNFNAFNRSIRIDAGQGRVYLSAF